LLLASRDFSELLKFELTPVAHAYYCKRPSCDKLWRHTFSNRWLSISPLSIWP
uniref:Uncharacterized protein n=1 Tax=Haemonchus placei TaxID=6290 RepID=A0A0N4WSV4_HAEPC